MGKLPQISDYVDIMNTPQLLKASVLKDGHVVKQNDDTIIRYTGGFCVVFPFQTSTKKYAIRCWHSNLAKAQERTREIANELQRVHLPYFVKFEYLPNALASNEGLQPIVLMDWVDAKPLKGYIGNYINDGGELRSLANRFLSMVKDLHAHGLSHGDLQHGNILIKEDGSLVLVDYDSMYVPSLNGFTDEIKGLPGYQHEARRTNRMLTPKADYFSELVIYTTLITLSKYPWLWKELNMEDSETLLFSADDVKSKGTSYIFNKLDEDEELRLLSTKLKDAMRCSTLDELFPLEQLLSFSVDDISKKWSNNGYKTPISDNSDTINSISKSWNISCIQQAELPRVDTITKKW